VRHHDRGLNWFERQGQVSVARLIAQIALAWPKKGVIVVVTRVEDARRLARRRKDQGRAEVRDRLRGPALPLQHLGGRAGTGGKGQAA
jgi:hypothetical protein